MLVKRCVKLSYARLKWVYFIVIARWTDENTAQQIRRQGVSVKEEYLKF